MSTLFHIDRNSYLFFFFLMIRRPPRSPLFPNTPLFRSVKDPRILILDDATSSVDATTEAQIRGALRGLMRERTTFIIGHRLSTIALADEIVVLEDGRIAAQGTHDELLERSDLYREIAEKGLPDQVFLTRKPAEREVAGL